MTYTQLAYLHLGTIVPAFLLGTLLLLRPKGTPFHRSLGRLYMLLMLTTAVITLIMPARVGPTLFDHFGPIHLFSLLVLYSVPASYLAIRQGDVTRHRKEMVALYIGMLIAGLFTLAPGRLIHGWLFSQI